MGCDPDNRKRHGFQLQQLERGSAAALQPGILNAVKLHVGAHTRRQHRFERRAGAAMDPYNWKGSYGNANWDIRHRFVASYFYELPFFKTAKHWGRYVLGGWQINAITTLQSGTPINVTVSTDPPNTGRPGGMRPDLIAPAVADCGSGRLVGCLSASSFRDADALQLWQRRTQSCDRPRSSGCRFQLVEELPARYRAREAPTSPGSLQCLQHAVIQQSRGYFRHVDVRVDRFDADPQPAGSDSRQDYLLGLAFRTGETMKHANRLHHGHCHAFRRVKASRP